MTPSTHSIPRQFEPLPIDATRGFPQDFAFVFEDAEYRFRLYVNLAAEALAGGAEFFELPGDGHLVARVETGAPGSTLFLRKVVPGLTYTCGQIALEFPEQLVARANLNGRGDAGSRVAGRIAKRWP